LNTIEATFADDASHAAVADVANELSPEAEAEFRGWVEGLIPSPSDGEPGNSEVSNGNVSYPIPVCVSRTDRRLSVVFKVPSTPSGKWFVLPIFPSFHPNVYLVTGGGGGDSGMGTVQEIVYDDVVVKTHGTTVPLLQSGAIINSEEPYIANYTFSSAPDIDAGDIVTTVNPNFSEHKRYLCVYAGE
jgi:hypothetical protein